uniref:Uncharacterized protein n=1 Tax=Bracoviriform kariyai TaxID=199362 RepID=Q8AZM6_9VIRU|nr:hypothetical protein [Bracoviriform kariyai]
MFSKVVFVFAALLATALAGIRKDFYPRGSSTNQVVDDDGFITVPQKHSDKPVSESLETEELPQKHKVEMMDPNETIEITKVEPLQPDHKTVEKLNCSSLNGYKIELENTEFKSIEYPCILRAQKIVLRNNLFWNPQSIIEMIAENITIEHNGFIGSAQDIRMIAEHVIVNDNVHIGQHQIHELYAPIIEKNRNIYDGDYQIHHLTGATIEETRNTMKGSYVRTTQAPITQVVPGKTPNDKENVIKLPLTIVHVGNLFDGPHQNKLPSKSGVKHLMTGITIRSKSHSPVIEEIVNMYDAALSN